MTAPTLPQGHDHWTMELADAVLPPEVERREVLDGELFVPVTGASTLHQRVAMMIAVALAGDAPADWSVLGSPLDVVTPWGDVCQPDLLAAPTADLDPRGAYAAPALVVEVRSPSTARVDAVRKRRIYERLGVGAYWLVDPEARTVTVLRPDELGRLVEAHVSEAGADVSLDHPWSLTLRWTV